MSLTYPIEVPLFYTYEAYKSIFRVEDDLIINADDDATFEISGDGFAVWSLNTGVVTINGGNYIHNGSREALGDDPALIYTSGDGFAVINDGYFSPAKDCPALNTYIHYTPMILTYGGQYVGFDPALGDDQDSTFSFLPEGYQSTAIGTTEDGRTIYEVTKM